MEQQQAQSSFQGFAIVEIFGHSRAIGYVTTEYFGGTAMLRVDTPGAEEREFTLERPQYVADRRAPIGSKVKRPARPATSQLLGMGSVFRITPCTEEAAQVAIDEMLPVPLILLSVPDQPKLPAGSDPMSIECPDCGAAPWDSHAPSCGE